jgi:hypothetical protein
MKQLAPTFGKLTLLISLSLLSSCGSQIGTGRSNVEVSDYPTGLTARQEVAQNGEPVCNYRARIVYTPHVRFAASSSYTTEILFTETRPELNKPYSLTDHSTSGSIQILNEYDGSLKATSFVVTFRQADDSIGSAVVMDYVLETVTGIHSEGTLQTTLLATDYVGCASPL